MQCPNFLCTAGQKLSFPDFLSTPFCSKLLLFNMFQLYRQNVTVFRNDRATGFKAVLINVIIYCIMRVVVSHKESKPRQKGDKEACSENRKANYLPFSQEQPQEILYHKALFFFFSKTYGRAQNRKTNINTFK